MTSILSVKNLTKVYDQDPAISSVSFEVGKGEVVGFVGLNGAGKSTTINILLGFLNATSGGVKIFGEAVKTINANESHKSIGFASGDMHLFENLRANQYFDFVLRRYGVRDRSRLQELITKFKPEMDKKIGNLSRGNKQKIALISAFMTEPKLVILDEPSSGLDPLMQQVFVDLVREEAARGTTVFMSSHYLNEVTDVSTRILLIKDGQIVKDIPTSELSRTGGKMVRVVSGQKIVLPPKAKALKQVLRSNHNEVTFVYSGAAANFQKWLVSVKDLKDIEIVDHSREEAFEDLYALESEGANNA